MIEQTSPPKRSFLSRNSGCRKATTRVSVPTVRLGSRRRHLARRDLRKTRSRANLVYNEPSANPTPDTLSGPCAACAPVAALVRHLRAEPSGYCRAFCRWINQSIQPSPGRACLCRRYPGTTSGTMGLLTHHPSSSAHNGIPPAMRVDSAWPILPHQALEPIGAPRRRRRQLSRRTARLPIIIARVLKPGNRIMRA